MSATLINHGNPARNAIGSPTFNEQVQSSTNRHSQNNTVLNWLKSGQTLTAAQAANYFGIYRLSARIYDLKEKGHPIKSELKFHKSEHWSVYSLEKQP